MRPYTFYLFDGRHREPHFDFIECEDHKAAMEEAGRLLERFPEYVSIEVFDGDNWRRSVAPARLAQDAQPMAI